MVDNVKTNSNAVLIIGNGFDKNCGLKTSYQDLYDEYLASPSTSNLIVDFKRTIGKEFEKWSDFEIGMSVYAQTIKSENNFLVCLDDFNGFMHDYLKRIQTDFHDKWSRFGYHSRSINEFSNSINNLGYGVTHNIDDILRGRDVSNVERLNFISFNYTDIFDSLLDIVYGHFHAKPVHVHGVLGDDPILGMDRVEQLNLKYDVSTKFKRHFIKPFFNSEYDSSRVNNAVNMIKSADTIFVYGASLGESDLSWRDLLFQWLLSDKNNHLFIYFHRNAIRTFKTVHERLDYEEQQQKIVLKSWGINTDDIPLEQFHLPCSINLFKIGESIKADQNEYNSKAELIKKTNDFLNLN